MTKRFSFFLTVAIAFAGLLFGLSYLQGQHQGLVEPAHAQGNVPPVADAGLDRTVALGETVVLDGTGTTDPRERKLQAFSWTVVSLPAGSLATLDDASLVKPTFTVDLPGTYVFDLTVSQGPRTSSPDQVVISTANSVPVAHGGYD